MFHFSSPESTRPASFHLIILATILGLVLVFHHFFLKFPFGFPFVIFILAYLAGLHLLLVLNKSLINRWAYIFLIPVAASLFGEIMYASEATRALAFCLTAVSLALFTFWISATAQTFAHLKRLWPMRIVKETIFPFPALRTFKPVASSSLSTKHLEQLFLGLAVALPFLIVLFALFVSADQFFSSTITSWLKIENFPQHLGLYFVDTCFGIFLLAYLWTALRRKDTPQEESTAEATPFQEHLAANTFLILINALFLLFIAFQFVYLFGGENYVRAQNIVYAEYGRNGFFQLLAVSAIVFGITWAVYWITHQERPLTRWLNALLIAQTAIIMISATKRLWLYVDVYGLTLSRWWGFAGILLIAIALLLCLICIARQCPFAKLVRNITFVSLAFLSIMVVLNNESLITRFNIHRTVTEGVALDSKYLLFQLSSDALTPFATFFYQSGEQAEIILRRPVQATPTDNRYGNDKFLEGGDMTSYLKQKRSDLLSLYDQSWRNLVISDYRALMTLEAGK